VEVDDRGGREQRVETLRVAQVDDRSGEPSSLNRRVEAGEDPGDHFVAGVRVVGLDGVEEVLEVWGEQLRQRDREREVELRELEQLVEETAQRIVIEASQLASCGACLKGEVAAREILLARPAALPAAPFDLAA
jgi:hypothetical protein